MRMRMSRLTDLQWFLTNREELAARHSGRWIVVHDKRVFAEFEREEAAVEFTVERFGIDVASVFLAASQDPVSFVGAIRA
jgi:hypothetical protein